MQKNWGDEETTELNGAPELGPCAGLIERFFAMARFQFSDRLEHLRQIDVVSFETLADATQKRDGQFATEMLAEFLETVQDIQFIRAIGVNQFIGEKFEAQ